jgi:IMP dehydrogenase
LAELKALKEQTGFSGIPVVQDGKLVGIVTNRDMRFAGDLNQ